MNEVLEDLFEYHAPTPEMVEKLKLVRAKAKELAYVIDECCPPSPDRTACMRDLQTAINTANRAIVLEGKSYR